MDSIVENIRNQLYSLLIGLNNSNSIERLKVIQEIKRDIESIENSVKDIIDVETEIKASINTGINKHYPDTNKEKYNV